MFAPLSGKLSITLKRGKDLRKTQMLGKQDPYVEVKFAGQKEQTKVHNDGDRFPVWDSTMEFTCQTVQDFTIKLSVWNKNVAALDDSIGVLQIPVLVLLSNPSVWLPIYRYEDHRTECGKILVETKFEGSGGVPVRQHSNFGLISARYGLGNVNVNVLPFVQSIVRDLKLVIPPNVDLSEIFKMDPISGHTDKSLFITYLLGDGKTSNGIHIPESGRRQETVVQLADFSSRQQEQGVAMKAAESQRLKHQAAEVKALQEQAQAEAKKEAELRKSSEASLEAVKKMATAQEARLNAEIKHMQNMLREEEKKVQRAQLEISKLTNEVELLRTKLGQANMGQASRSNMGQAARSNMGQGSEFNMSQGLSSDVSSYVAPNTYNEFKVGETSQLPGGSWKQTAKHITYSGGILKASLRNSKGWWKTSEIRAG
ncbi:hypothetical protein AAMO2058_000421900 [Amorphochlora amoebiformis]